MYVCVQKLTPQCGDHIRMIIKESAVDYKQDSALARACAAEVCKVFVNKAIYNF